MSSGIGLGGEKWPIVAGVEKLFDIFHEKATDDVSHWWRLTIMESKITIIKIIIIGVARGWMVRGG